METQTKEQKEQLVQKILNEGAEAVAKVIEEVKVSGMQSKIDKDVLEKKMGDKEKLVQDKKIIRK